ncbi:hypothetical protein PIB30_010936 [Stylosanthes scabra]|uniref:RING-type E3 ubiquitin transferase n=1 Tax=Stylosanthes scabra TaxID=79078 RepID=A0ABU6U4X1_9FABA|nr:hypothetical protein [Stylosanthes scabra]
MRVVTTTTETATTVTVAEQHMKWRRPRNHRMITEETDPSPPRCKSTISSLLLSTFSNNNNDGGSQSRKKSNFSAAATFRGLGCTAVIRSSAEWEGKKVRKKKHKRSSKGGGGGGVDFEDVWCGAPLSCCSSSRPKIDVQKMNERERQRSSSCLGRRSVNPETISLLDHTHPTDAYYPHQIMMLQEGASMLMGARGRLTTHDQFRDWRLDVDNMSYEQLLELGDRIGHVSTGLKENEMAANITKTKLQVSDDQVDKTCTICQEEYEAEDQLGSLHCDHTYHFQCIKQWVAHKNFCPVCKQQVLPRNN